MEVFHPVVVVLASSPGILIGWGRGYGGPCFLVVLSVDFRVVIHAGRDRPMTCICVALINHVHHCQLGES